MIVINFSGRRTRALIAFFSFKEQELEINLANLMIGSCNRWSRNFPKWKKIRWSGFFLVWHVRKSRFIFRPAAVIVIRDGTANQNRRNEKSRYKKPKNVILRVEFWSPGQGGQGKKNQGKDRKIKKSMKQKTEAVFPTIFRNFKNLLFCKTKQKKKRTFFLFFFSFFFTFKQWFFSV